MRTNPDENKDQFDFKALAALYAKMLLGMVVIVMVIGLLGYGAGTLLEKNGYGSYEKR